MEQETTLAQSIRVLGIKARYDEACKQLLSEKSILAWIMKSCLEEYKDCTVKEIEEKYITGEPVINAVALLPGEANAPTRIQSVGQEDVSLDEHTITYDIRFIASAPSTGEPIRLIINLEAQNAFSAGYPLLKRAIYYCSRMISSQYGTEFTHAQYGKIKKVYSIFLCTTPPQSHRNTVTRYRMTEENLIGLVHEPIEHYDLLTVVMLCLGDAEDENYGGILRLLDVLLSNKIGFVEKQRVLQQDFDLAMTEKMEREVQSVCNLSDGVWNRAMTEGRQKGMQEGMEKGMEKGIAKGMEKGIAKALTDAIRSLMKSTKWSVDQAMTALEVPEEERPKYRELLGQQ